jgi:hypothetical protein
MKDKVQLAIKKIREARKLAQSNPGISEYLRPEVTFIPPLYREFLRLPFELPTPPELRQSSTPLEVTDDTNAI